jgi:hypothetical protein
MNAQMKWGWSARRFSATRNYLLLCILALIPALSMAQQFTGRVPDVSGAVLPEASITVVHEKTSVSPTAGLSTWQNNFQAPAPKQDIDRNALTKIDHNFTSTEDWTPTFSPNLLFDFRSSVIVRAGFNNYSPLGFDQSTLGWRFPQTHLNVGYAPRDSTADRTPTPEAGYGSALTAQTHARGEYQLPFCSKQN